MSKKNRKIHTPVKSIPMQPNNSLFARLGRDALNPGRAAVYLRVGSFGQDGGKSALKAQERTLQQYAVRHGWTVVARYVDAASGIDDRGPGLRRLMMDARKGSFDAVLVHSYSKVYRTFEAFLSVVNELKKTGVKVISATQPVGIGYSEVTAKFLLEIFSLYEETRWARRK